MDKIKKNLKGQCQSDLKKEFKIIVTGSIKPEEATQIGLNPITGLDNIFSGSVTGEKIIAIEKLKTVDSIELDSNMEILQDR
ncbi:MAG: hypothetical protein L0Y39_08785 [Methylococcaceae bacterium]|nr:hypothetical protein [Methylococcaceae bacterium]